MNKVLSKFIAGSALFAVSFNASAFPIVALNSIGYLVPILLTILAGGSGMKNRKHVIYLITGMFFVIAYLSATSMINHVVNTYSIKQEYFSANNPIQVNHDELIPFDIVPEILNSNDRAKLIKIQNVHSLYVNDSDTYGYAEHNKAIDYINSNELDYVFLRSHSYQNLIDFGTKLSTKTKAKIFLINPEVTKLDGEDENGIMHYNAKPFNPSDISILDRSKTLRASLLDNYNIISVSTRISSSYPSYKEGMILLDVDLLHAYGEKYLTSIADKIDKKKATIFITNENEVVDGKGIAHANTNILLNQLSKYSGVKDFYVTTDTKLTRVLSFRNDDPTVTKSHINDNKFFTPIDVYARTYSDFGYFTYLCFTDECVDTMGRDYSVNVSNLRVFGMAGSLSIDLQPLEKYKNDRLVIVSNDLFSSLLGKLLAKQLADNNFNFKGFTYHYALYFGAFQRAVIDGVNSALYEDYFINELIKSLSILNYELIDEVKIINIYVLFLACVILGALSVSKNEKLANISSVGFVFGTYVLINFFQLKPEMVDIELFGVLYTASLLALFIYLKKQSWKWSLFTLIIYVFIYTVTSVSCIINYTLSFYSIGGVLAITFGCKRDRKIKKRIGEKYLLTVNHISKHNKGWLIESQKDLLRVIKNKKYLLRSNHLTKEEMDVSGKFESYIVNGKQDGLCVLNVALNDAQKLLKKDDIQFWLMPHVTTIQKGVMQSIGTNIGLIGISLGVCDSVTLGTSCDYHEVDRDGNCTSWSGSKLLMSRLIKKIKQIESIEGLPVIVEFGITKSRKIEIFQVRHQRVSYSQNQVQNALIGRYSVLANESGTVLGSSVLSKLTEGRVVLSQTSLSMLKVDEPNQNLNYTLTENRLIGIINDLSEVDLSKAFTVNSKVGLIKDIIEPIISLYFSGSPILSKTVQDLSVLDCMRESISRFGELPGYDIADQPVCVSLKNCNLVSIKYVDLLHLIVSIALIRLRNEFCAEFNDINRIAGSTISQLDEKIFIESDLVNTNVSETIIVVNGSFAGAAYTVEDFLLLSEAQQAKAVIRDDFIPLSYMMACMNASAIIVKNGTPLSHVAQTAKSLKVPFKIEKQL